jgi:hypothetical protein
LLRKSARRNTHDKHAVFDQFHATVLAEWTLHNGRPESACSIDKAEIDATQSSGQRVEKCRQWRRLIVARCHDSTRERSISAAGVKALGRGDAVVTSV